MNAYEIKKELNELENYIKDMETESDWFKRCRMTNIAESWYQYLWNEQTKCMKH